MMWDEKGEEYYKELSRRRELHAPLSKIEESATTQSAIALLKDITRSLEKADGQVVSLNTEYLFRGIMNNTQTKITVLLEPWVNETIASMRKSKMNKVIIRHEPNNFGEGFTWQDQYEIYYIEWNYAKNSLVERYFGGKDTYEEAVACAREFFNRKKPDMVLDL